MAHVGDHHGAVKGLTVEPLDGAVLPQVGTDRVKRERKDRLVDQDNLLAGPDELLVCLAHMKHVHDYLWNEGEERIFVLRRVMSKPGERWTSSAA